MKSREKEEEKTSGGGPIVKSEAQSMDINNKSMALEINYSSGSAAIKT